MGIFDGDYASRTFDHADPARAREYDDIINSTVTSPRVNSVRIYISMVSRRFPRLSRWYKARYVT